MEEFKCWSDFCEEVVSVLALWSDNAAATYAEKYDENGGDYPFAKNTRSKVYVRDQDGLVTEYAIRVVSEPVYYAEEVTK